MRQSVGFETYKTSLARVTYVLMCSKTDIVLHFSAPHYVSSIQLSTINDEH